MFSSPALPMFRKKEKEKKGRIAKSCLPKRKKELTIDGISALYPFIHTFTHSMILHTLHPAWEKGPELYRLWDAELGCYQTEERGPNRRFQERGWAGAESQSEGDTMCSSNCRRFKEAAVRREWETGVRCSPGFKGPYTQAKELDITLRTMGDQPLEGRQDRNVLRYVF